MVFVKSFLLNEKFPIFKKFCRYHCAICWTFTFFKPTISNHADIPFPLVFIHQSHHINRFFVQSIKSTKVGKKYNVFSSINEKKSPLMLILTCEVKLIRRHHANLRLNLRNTKRMFSNSWKLLSPRGRSN